MEGYKLFDVPAGTVIDKNEDGTFVLRQPDGSTRLVTVRLNFETGDFEVIETTSAKDCGFSMTVSSAEPVKD